MDYGVGIRRPDPIVFHGNVAENWRRFNEIYIEAAQTGKEKAYILLNVVGQEATEKSRSFT